MDVPATIESKAPAMRFTSIPSRTQLLRTVFGFLQAANVVLWVFVEMSTRFGILRGVLDLYTRAHPQGELPYLCAFVLFAIMWIASGDLPSRRKWLSFIIL